MKIDDSISFRRAMDTLKNRIISPNYLIDLWLLLPKTPARVPYPEACESWWYEGLEDKIFQ